MDRNSIYFFSFFGISKLPIQRLGFRHRLVTEKIFLIALYYTFKFSFLINDSASQREFIGHLDRELSFR